MSARPRVLLVDDDPSITHVVASFLEDEGYHAHEVNDSPSALAIARGFRPDAMILDFRMPYMSGVDVAWQFAGDPVLKGLPVLICTGSADELPKHQLPPDDIPVVPKPFNPQVILAWLRERLGEPIISVGAAA